MKLGSRLLVVVEDTTATRDLWPLWRQKALEPVLHKIESAAFGPYELNFVSFSSVDGQNDGLIRSGNWTCDVNQFRQYFQSLTFEGGGGGHGLGEALMEATYLTRQPSTLGKLEDLAQHVLLCATGCMGRLSVLWPFREQLERQQDCRAHALSILAFMNDARGLSVSMLTERSSNGVMSKRFGALAGTRALKKCEELSKGRHCLMLIHPKWRHGYQWLFPECTDIDAWPEMPQKTASESENSSKTCTAPVEPCPKDTVPYKATGQPSQASVSCLPEPTALSIKQLQDCPDAMPLSAWMRSGAKRCWKAEDIEMPDTSCLEAEFALEQELLGLEALEDSISGTRVEEKSKQETSSSCGGAASPAHSSTKQPATLSIPNTELPDPFATPAAQLASAEDVSSSSQSQRVAIASQRSKTMSSSASVSIDMRSASRRSDVIAKRQGPGNGAVIERGFQRMYAHASWPLPAASDVPHALHSVRSYPRADDQILSPFQNQDVREAKRPRTKYGNSNQSAMKLPPINDREEHASFVFASQQSAWGMESTPMPPFQAPQRAAMPSSGFEWRVEWRGPLYLAGPIMRQSEPQKLFDVEILSERPLPYSISWPADLVVHRLEPKEQQRCPVSCTVSLKRRTMTEMGRTFTTWLIENNMIAIVDLSEKAIRLIISAQERNIYGHCQLMAGFQIQAGCI